MNALRATLPRWIDSGELFAIATVTSVSGSAPRTPGACMLVSADGSRFEGSASSGCLEAEVIEAATAAIRTGHPRHLKFGPDGLPPWRDGLTCGGLIDVRVEPWWGFSPRASVRAIAPRVLSWLKNDEPGVVLSTDEHHLALGTEGGDTGDRTFDEQTVSFAQKLLEHGLPPRILETDNGSVFVRSILPRPHLFIVGAVDVAVSLVSLAEVSGFATTVVDPRRHFAQAERFPVAPGHIIRSWPQPAVAEAALGPRDAAVVLTHDPKIDDPALLALLETHVGYIGALGSTRSHTTRLERLRPLVAEQAVLQRIHGPAGLQLGAANPAGIALGILAGIVRWQAEDKKLRAATTSISVH